MKKANLKKVFAAFLAASCVMSFAACTKTDKGEPAPDVENITNETLVLTIGDEPVTYEEYRYFYLNSKRDMDQDNADYWTENPDSAETLKETTLKSISQYHAISSVAKDMKVEISDEAKQQTEDVVKSYNDSYGEEEFKKMLEESYLSIDLFKSIYSVTALESTVYDAIVADGTILKTDEATIKASLNGDDYIRVYHILYADEATAKDLLESAKSATDAEFYELAQSAEDPGMVGNEAGYCFTHGEMVAEFEDASFKLAVGETSDLVKSSFGYHIIRRIEKTPEYIDENYANLSGTFLQRAYYEYLDEYAAKLTESAKFESVYEALGIDSVK